MKYGLTTLGMILTIILIIPGLVFGALILLFWYMKMDDIKSSLSRAFPGYVPPQRSAPSNFNQQTGAEDQKVSDRNPPPPPTSD